MTLTLEQRDFKTECLKLAMKHMDALKPQIDENEFMTAVFNCAEAYYRKAEEIGYFNDNVQYKKFVELAKKQV